MSKTARERLDSRALDYRLTFGAPTAESVLADLARFCRANESTFHPDPRIHAVLEGRREVWLRLRDHLDLDNDTLSAKYGAET